MLVLRSTLNAHRLLVEDNYQIGMLVDQSDLILDDAIVRATHPQPSGGGGDGIFVQRAGRFEAHRLEISEVNRMGISLLGMVDAELEDVAIHDTIGAMQGGNDPSRAINVQGGTLTGTRLLAERNAGIGVAVLGGEATLVDTTIRDTRLNEDGVNGWGLAASGPARVTGMGVDVEGSHEFGVLAIVGASIDLEHARIRDTQASTRPGHGVMSADGDVRLTDFEVRGATTCGVLVTGASGALDLARGVVEGSAIGACVQVDGYDLSRIQQDVSYRDNDINLDSTTLPTPTPPNALPMF
jgi:hypothetical protein